MAGEEGKPCNAFENWVRGREVHVCRAPDVGDAVAAPVVAGINDIIRRTGLTDFMIDPERHYLGVDLRSMELAALATDGEGRLDGAALGKLLTAGAGRDLSRKGRPHADVLISGQSLALGSELWGQADFASGYIVISVPGSRQSDLEYIRSIARHEAGHLFGFRFHHEDSGETAGYGKADGCVMSRSATSPDICAMCLDALVHFWKGIEELHGEKFIKKRFWLF